MESVVDISGESLSNSRIKTSLKKDKKDDLLKKFQEKAFDFSFLEHESEDINTPEETCIALIHGYNAVAEKHDETLNGLSRAQRNSYNREGIKLMK